LLDTASKFYGKSEQSEARYDITAIALRRRLFLLFLDIYS
jgi:hypothetical protein